MDYAAALETAEQIVEQIVVGDVYAVSQTKDWTPVLVTELSSIYEWTVTAEATIVVLKALKEERFSKLAIRFWADFVRTGRPGGVLDQGPARALHIEWEPAHEDEINEAIARLSELGDDQDGEMSIEEIDGFIALLGTDSR